MSFACPRDIYALQLQYYSLRKAKTAFGVIDMPLTSLPSKEISHG